MKKMIYPNFQSLAADEAYCNSSYSVYMDGYYEIRDVFDGVVRSKLTLEELEDWFLNGINVEFLRYLELEELLEMKGAYPELFYDIVKEIVRKTGSSKRA